MKKLIVFCLIVPIIVISCRKEEITDVSIPPFATSGSKLPFFQIETKTGISSGQVKLDG